MQLEFACRQRLAQVLLHDAAGLHLQVHHGFEEAECAAAVALGAVEREVGVAQQFVGVRSVAGADRNTDADADHGLLAVDVVGLAQRIDDALRQRSGLGGICDRGLHDHELIASHPRDGVGVANEPAQPFGDDPQQLVAAGMAERIVDGLELIEVEMMDGHHFRVLNPAQRVFEPVVQQHPVGQISQRIVVRHVFDLHLGLALLGDVLMRGDPAAAGHRPVTDLEGAPVHQFDDAVLGFVGNRNVGAPAQIFVPRHRGKAAGFEPEVDDLDQRHAGADALGRNIVHLDEAIVADDQAVVGIEEA